MREPWRQRDRERERRMDGFPLIELFHNKVTRLATFPQPTLQGLQGLPSYQPLQKSCEKDEETPREKSGEVNPRNCFRQRKLWGVYSF
jgi:hypothetical protein